MGCRDDKLCKAPGTYRREYFSYPLSQGTKNLIKKSLPRPLRQAPAFPCLLMLCYEMQPQIIAIRIRLINLIKTNKLSCYLFIAVASRMLRGDFSKWF